MTCSYAIAIFSPSEANKKAAPLKRELLFLCPTCKSVFSILHGSSTVEKRLFYHLGNLRIFLGRGQIAEYDMTIAIPGCNFELLLNPLWRA